LECTLDTCIDRRNSDSAKWGRYDADVLPLWVADMDFLSAEPVLRALRARIDHGIFGYCVPPTELVDVIRARLARLYNWQVAADAIVFMPGVVTGFNMACHMAGRPGDGVLVQPPVYYPFLGAPANAGRELQMAEIEARPLGSVGASGRGPRYELDVEAFEAAFTERTRAFILCNPHNPIGRVYEREELQAMAEVCLRHDALICSDEIHCDLIFSGHQHTPIAALDPEISQHTITLMAPSKTYNIAGLKCSFAVIENEELRERFRATGQGLVPSVNLLGYTAALAAYRDGTFWLEEVLAYMEANRDFLKRYVDEHLPGVEMIVPEGTYLAWLDCTAAALDGTGVGGENPCDPAAFFLEQARVALNNGAAFGPGGEGHVRLNFACPRETLVEALERMRAALERRALERAQA
jgi:cystathionine beta-lyase